ncbi:MAG: hypothetical protein ACRD52_16230, partial [Candidatus Acidiferrales bacterium]
MRKQIPVLLGIMVLASIVVAKGKCPLSDAESAGITERGRMLEEYDQAARHSTDVVRAMNPKEGSATRYVAEKTSAG